MISKVIIREIDDDGSTITGGYWEFDLRNDDPSVNPFYIKSIDGLGPIGADISTSKLGSGDGSVFNDATYPERVINMDIGFIPYSDNEKNRTDYLYKHLAPGTHVQLEFARDSDATININGNRVDDWHWIDGYVSIVEPDIFSDDCSCKVEFICPFPWFRHHAIITENATKYPGSPSAQYLRIDIPADYTERPVGFWAEFKGLNQSQSTSAAGNWQLEMYLTPSTIVNPWLVKDNKLQGLVAGLSVGNTDHTMNTKFCTYINTDPPGRFIKMQRTADAAKNWSLSWLSANNHDWITIPKTHEALNLWIFYTPVANNDGTTHADYSNEKIDTQIIMSALAIGL